MKKILLCLFAFLLLTGCAKTPQEALLPDTGRIMSIAPSYDTRYYARSMPLITEELPQKNFCEAYTQVLSAAQQTDADLPEGDEYCFEINVSDGGFTKKNLRLIDAGETVFLELTQKEADWILTYTVSKAGAQPLLDYFADEPLSKPHIESNPFGRVVPLAERWAENWPLVQAEVIAVSDEVKEFIPHESLQYGWLYREFTVRVMTSYSGSTDSTLTYRMLGGENDDYSFSVPDAPQVQVGDIVFIAAKEHSFISSYDLFHYHDNDYTYTVPAGFLPDSYGLAPRTMDYTSTTECLLAIRDAFSDYKDALRDRPDRVSDAELARLLWQYPPSGPAWDSLLSYGSSRSSWEDLRHLDGLVQLDFTGAYYKLSPDGTFLEGNDLLADPFAMGMPILFARVEKILYGCEGLKEGDLIPVGLGAPIASHVTLTSLFSGRQMITLLQKYAGSVYPLPGLYATSLTYTFTLVPGDVVLYAGQEVECLEELSGMYLEPFVEAYRSHMD